MNSHLKRKILQFLMNTWFLRLRPIPRPKSESTGGLSGEKDPDRVDRLIASMDRAEKIDYVSGIKGFCVRPIPRLAVPPVWMGDATSGIRGVDAPVTVFPSAIAMAASWNPKLVEEVGRAIGEECRAAGISVLLGPGVNIARIPVCGRNFEYMGEDPYLAGQVANSYISGVQSKHVVATVKHFACNNSEYDRHKCDSVVSMKVLRELYLPAFETTVAHGVMGVMTAYNPINGVYASEHEELVGSILRKEWGFQGIVVSDWNSLYSCEGPLLHGVDIEMPAQKWLSEKNIGRLLDSHPDYAKYLDQKVGRLLDVFDSIGVLDRPVVDESAPLGTAEHSQTALSMACESIVLMKNDEMLPLEGDKLSEIVVIGSCAKYESTGGGGSSFIKQGYPGGSLANELRRQLPHCRIRMLTGSWWRNPRKRGFVSSADVVIASVGFDHIDESESYDRQWELPHYDRTAIKEACETNDRVVVALHGGGALGMGSWVDNAKAILHCWYLGRSSAQAIADTLLGKNNPSGKLPISIAHDLQDYESMKTYPKDYAEIRLKRIQGGQGDPHKRDIWSMVYSEGLMVGYRQFDTIGPNPLFPFGHGLSYTGFSYTGLLITPSKDGQWDVSFTVSNIGDREGAEVAQIYVRPPDYGKARPFQQLRAFEKVSLHRGERRDLTLSIDHRAFSEWEEKQEGWLFVHGVYTIAVGSSSRDIRLSGILQV